jgi:hypothetical protein
MHDSKAARDSHLARGEEEVAAKARGVAIRAELCQRTPALLDEKGAAGGVAAVDGLVCNVLIDRLRPE